MNFLLVNVVTNQRNRHHKLHLHKNTYFAKTLSYKITFSRIEMSTLDMCMKYYGTADIYEVFNLSKQSSQSQSEYDGLRSICDAVGRVKKYYFHSFFTQIQKAYHHLSLETHPDRVALVQREIATRKFQILSKLYGILTNTEKRKLYEDEGVIEEDAIVNGLPVPTFVITSAHIESCKKIFFGKKIRFNITIELKIGFKFRLRTSFS